MIDRYLSIWEVAHRWRECNPDTSDPANLPLNVQDAIRYICRGILDGEITLLEIVVMKPVEEKGHIGSRSKLEPFWVSNPPPEIEKALYREYGKITLNSYFIEYENLFNYCVHEQSQRSGSCVQLDFPDCWWSFISSGYSSVDESENPETPQEQLEPQILRPSNIHKLICQAIAKTLWDSHPDMTIAAMTEHRAILEYGSGKYYKGKNTLRDWLSEVAPAEVRKPGRRKSSKPNGDAA